MPYSVAGTKKRGPNLSIITFVLSCSPSTEGLTTARKLIEHFTWVFLVNKSFRSYSSKSPHPGKPFDESNPIRHDVALRIPL